MEDRWTPPDLSGLVALVTGATKGVGRGIAEVLIECGATVYATGRRPERLTAHNGLIPVRCDHRNDVEVAGLVERIRNEQGRLDVLVNNVVAWSDQLPENEGAGPGADLWEQSLSWWDNNFDGGVRAHVATCRFALPLLLESDGPRLVLFTSELASENPEKTWDVVLDLRAVTTRRLVTLLAAKLAPKTTVALLYPGWTRTEDIIANVEAGTYAVKTQDELIAKTVSPHYTGRAAAMLSADEDRRRYSGDVVSSEELAAHYGFTDVDGSTKDPI
jgi:NAD(P)-dependent dehydrogenase (short-subunit alcohol dehydrogenase family)